MDAAGPKRPHAYVQGRLHSKHLRLSKRQRNFHIKRQTLPSDPEKLSLEVGTPWVDRVSDRKSVPGFFVI